MLGFFRASVSSAAGGSLREKKAAVALLIDVEIMIKIACCPAGTLPIEPQASRALAPGAAEKK